MTELVDVSDIVFLLLCWRASGQCRASQVDGSGLLSVQ